MLVRRLLLLAAVLVLLTALAAGLAPRQSSDNGSTVERSSVPAGETVTKKIEAKPGANTKVRVSRGDLLELEVSGDTLDSVLIERLDRVRAIEPTTPARFNIVIDAAAGRYPIRLVDADRRIGSLVISD